MKIVRSLVALAVASALRVSMETEGSWSVRGMPTGWKTVQRSPADHGIQLVFAVKQQHVAELEKTLLAVSTPGNARYGQHLSNEQVHALVAPADEHSRAVRAFLAEHGLQGAALTSNEDFIQVDLTVAQAEKLLATTYHELEHESGQTVHRASGYTLPEEVAAAVDLVAPTVHIPKPQSRPKQPVDAAAPEFVNTPAVLRKLYSVGDALGQVPSNKMAVTAFLRQYYSESDLRAFWKGECSGLTCGKGLPKLVGDATTGNPGVESMLDIESITGVAGNISAEFWGFAGTSPDNKENEPFLKWLTTMAGTADDDVPKVFSTSYGEDEDSWGLDAATRLNTEFMKAGARGISLLYASGDEGANCERGKFKPETPGSSPYVTAVGGTTGSTGSSAIGLSSGGFSDRWPMPEWQAAAVKEYLSSADVPDLSYGYNVSGRAYPDISAQASDFTVYVNGYAEPGVAGTSCATPTVSGVIALLNDARLQAGQPVLGFLNPWIYQNMKEWNDITTGSNRGCSKGWPAVAGWDAATGVGTANYANLVKALP